jgi:uncharacterized peroxidase-related enzyme
MTSSEILLSDVVDAAVPLAEGDPLYGLRRERQKIVDATQASYIAMFSPAVAGVSVVERLLVALHACELSKASELAGHYRQRLELAGAGAALVSAAGSATGGTATADRRVSALLAFTAKLVERPIEGDRAAVQSLASAGLSASDIVAVAQLIAFVSYQLRLVAGLQALAGAGEDDAARPASQREPASSGRTIENPIRIGGFTNEVLAWTPWVDPVRLEEATPEQMSAMDTMSPTAKDQPYFRLLAHHPEMLLQRSIAFNAIMFAPGGMPRAERELGATVESRLNGCVYCTSVHAQRFEQLAKRNDVIAQLFENPATAGTSPREKAIVRFSAKLGLRPAELGAQDVREARAAGLTDAETLDLVHSVALFAWANRLMQNLGEPVYPGDAVAAKERT